MPINRLKNLFRDSRRNEDIVKFNNVHAPKDISENDDGAYYEKLEFCPKSSYEEQYQPLSNTKEKRKDFLENSSFDKDKDAISNFSKNSYVLPKGSPLKSPYLNKILNKKDILFIVIEDSNNVEEYKNEIMKILNKMISNNTSRLLYFIRTGKNEKSFGLYDYQKLEQENFIDCLFDSSKNDEEVRLSLCVCEIYDFLYNLEMDKFELEYNNEKFEITEVNIIFIGTGASENRIATKSLIQDQLSNIKDIKNVKSIKYFCIKDRDMVSVASCGFPVIGHILTSFYQ